ncbi:hypothetical protein Dimus_037415, partial [Dionaea muscipula]
MEVAVSSTINTVSGGVALLPYIPEFETQARGSLLSSPGIIRGFTLFVFDFQAKPLEWHFQLLLSFLGKKFQLARSPLATCCSGLNKSDYALSGWLTIPLFVMAVELVLLKRMLVIQDQRMALDQGQS